MGIDKFNHEGYSDPTTYEALINIHREERELENLDRIPAELGGDLYLINGNMTKLEDAGIFAESPDTSGREEKENCPVWQLH